MSSIPEDLYLPILLRVTVKSTFVCKCVCKVWFSLISDPSFPRMHHDFTPHRNIPSNLMVLCRTKGNSDRIFSISYHSEPSLWKNSRELDLSELRYPRSSFSKYRIELLGSCNGLVSLKFYDWDCFEFFCVWNPATQEYKKLTQTEPANILAYHELSAFGYDNMNDDYKLVVASKRAVQVYTLRSDSWKSIIPDIPIPSYFYCAYRSKSGLLVNGYFHWLADAEQGRTIIVSLDISEERFKEIELPMELHKKSHWFKIVVELEGCLCVLVGGGRHGDDPGLVRVWVMQDYGVPGSWTERYIITHEMITRDILDYVRSLRFIRSLKNGGILFSKPGKLVLYDPKDGSADVRNIRGDIKQEMNYFESFVSVNSGTYMR